MGRGDDIRRTGRSGTLIQFQRECSCGGFATSRGRALSAHAYWKCAGSIINYEQRIKVDSRAVDGSDARLVERANRVAKVGLHERIRVEVGRAAHVTVRHVVHEGLRIGFR